MKRVSRFLRSQRGFGLVALLLVAFILGLLGVGGYVWYKQTNLINEGDYVPEVPDEVRVTEEGFGCNLPDGGNMLNGFYHPVVNMTMDMELHQFQYRMGRKGAGDKEYRVYVWSWDCENPDVHGEILGYSDVVSWSSVPGYAGYPAVQPWCTFTFSTAVNLYAGTNYTMGVVLTSGSVGQLYTMIANGDDCIPEKMLGTIYNFGDYMFHPDKDISYWMVGGVGRTPMVETVGYVLEADGTISLQGWTDVVGDMEVGFVVSSNETDIEGGQGAWYKVGMSGVSGVRYYFSERLISIVNDITYYFRAYARLGGMTWYGGIKSFMRGVADVPITMECDLIKNELVGIEFETAILGTHEGVSYNVSICYGESLGECISCNNSLAVAAEATNDTSWRTGDTCDNYFSAGVKYYYRGFAAGDDDSLSYSEVKSFSAYDPNQPGIINALSGFLNIPMDWIWWLVTAGLLLLVWLFAGKTKWWWVGVIGTLVVLIALITFGFVNPWVVVLLCIIAGWIIFKIVFAVRGGGGED